MIACRKAFLLTLMILLPGYLLSQIPVSSTFQRFNCRIPYLKDGGSKNLPGNAILREMAKDVLKEPWHVNIRVSGKLSLAVSNVGGEQDLLISFNSFFISGDTLYRKFPVTGVLRPSHITMKLKWANRADTTGYTEETLSLMPLPETGSMICRRPIAGYSSLVDTLMAREIEFFYDSLSLQKFTDRISLIHDYFAAVAILDSLASFSEAIHLDDAALLPYNYLKIEEVNRVIRRIDARNFPERLLNNGYDPSGLVRKYNDVFRYSRSLIYNFIDALRKTGAIPWDGDANRLAAFFTSRVYSYVNRSFLMDQQQGLIYNDCLDNLFEKSDFPADEHVVDLMLSKMFPDSRQDTIAAFISKRIYASYRKEAMQLMEHSRHAEAFSMMENGRRFVTANPFLRGISPDAQLQSQAARGICNSYVGIASSCIGMHKYDMAASYLAKAGDYLEQHADYRISDSAYRAVFSELFFLRNTDCDHLLESEKYREALDCYGQFEKSYAPRDLALVSDRLAEKMSVARLELSRESELLSADALKHKNADTALYYYEQAMELRHAAAVSQAEQKEPDSLAPVMASIKFDQIYREGSLALDKRQFTLSVSLFDDARSLAEDYRIDRGREFDSVYRRAMKNLLIIQLSASQKKIWANDFDSAQNAVQKTEAAGFKYGVLNDPEFSAALANYRQKITEQRCRNLEDSVNLRMIRADRGIANKNFIRTMDYLKEAAALLQSLPECNVPGAPIADSLAKYKSPASYQQKLKIIRSLIVIGSYDSAVHVFFINQQDYDTQRLDRFGLIRDDIYNFSNASNNPYFTQSVTVHYMALENYREACRFLLLCYEQGLPAGSTSNIQEQIAKKFAQEDYKQNRQTTALQDADKSVGPNKWFDAFRRAYKLEWSNLLKGK